MEIQTFFLAKSISKAGSANEYDSSTVGLHHFYPTNNQYPLGCKLPFYMLVRRELSDKDDSITLKFNLIDADGKNTGKPQNLKVAGKFPSGHKFMTVVGTVDFQFDDGGEYRLDITADEEKLPSIFHYNLFVGQ